MVKSIVAILPSLSAAVPSCSQLCADGGHGSVGFMSGTAPACGGECADCGDGHCYHVQKGDVSDYGHGCVTGSKVCCCSQAVSESEITSLEPSDDSVASLTACAGSDYTCCEPMCEQSCNEKHGHWCHDTGKCTWHQCHPCHSHTELEMDANETVLKQVEEAPVTPSDDDVALPHLSSCAGSDYECCEPMCEQSCNEKHGHWCHDTGKCTWHQCHPCHSLEMDANETALKQVEDASSDDVVPHLSSCAGSDYECCEPMCEQSCNEKHGHWCHNTGKCTWHQCHPCHSLEMDANETASNQVEDATATHSDDDIALPPLSSCAGSDYECCEPMCEHSCNEKHGHWCHNTGKCTWHQCHPCHSLEKVSVEFMV